MSANLARLAIGKTLDTAAIQKALDECGKSGGVVRFGPGTYLSKPNSLHSKPILQSRRHFDRHGRAGGLQKSGPKKCGPVSRFLLCPH